MRILITGAAGFLGSHLTEKMLSMGHLVIGLDDFSTGNVNNLNSVLKNRNFQFVQQDVRNSMDFQVDLILNFACPASPKHYQIDPVRTIETNFLGMINLLHLARKNKAKLIQASTSEIYGDPTISPQSEEYWGNVNPIGIRSCYDEGKRAAETLCFDYLRQFQLDIRVLRIFNTYGPNMAIDDGRVVSNFIVQALRNTEITMYGTGSQTRSFCYVDDLINAVIKIIDLPQNPNTPINVGNPTEFSILELAEKIIKLTSSKSKITFSHLPLDDPKQRRPDIKKANEILNWSPKISLEEGLLKTIEYFQEKVI